MMIWSVTVPDDVELDPTQVSRHQQQADQDVATRAVNENS